MNPNLKKRIESINKGIIPEGYKKTKVGIVPVEWEVKKLSEILHNESRPVEKPSEPYVRIGIRSHAKGTFHELVENPSEVNMDTLYVVKKYDLIVNITFAWEHAIALADEEDEGKLVSHRFPTYVFDNNSSLYYKYVFTQEIFRQRLELISPGGAGRNRVLNKTDFLNLEIYNPPLPEQQKIAEILSTQDKLIELHEKKVEKLKELKKAYLQKMFPQKGSKYPEIRFKGFTDAWEQRKYSEIINLLSGQDFEPSDYNDDGNGLPYMTGASCIVDGKTEVTRWTETPKCIANMGDVLLVCKGSGCGTIVILSQEKAHIARQFMALKCLDMLDNTFNLYLANSVVENIKKDARGLIAGIARDAVLNQVIRVPKLEEQTKIGIFFSELDTLITLHQRKSEQEKQKKKALMQLLLTGKVRCI